MSETGRQWTRAEFDWLVRMGEELLVVVKAHQNYGPRSEDGRAWLQQVESFIDAGLPANHRAAIDGASHRLRGFYLQRLYQTMDGPAFVEGTEKTVEALKASAGSYRFASDVRDEDFLEFLRTAKHEDAKLHMGEALTVDLVAKRAGLPEQVARACVRRAEDESLIYRHASEPDTNLYLETEDVEFAITRLERGPKRLAPVSEVKPSWTLDVSGVANADVRNVLENNVKELAQAQLHAMHMSGIVLAGSIGEGLLYDRLLVEKARAMSATAAPKGKGGVVKDLESGNWKLFDYINVAAELGLVAPTTVKMLHDVLREFRNMIHPKVQADMNLRPDASELKASVAWLEAVARDLKKYQASKTP